MDYDVRRLSMFYSYTMFSAFTPVETLADWNLRALCGTIPLAISLSVISRFRLQREVRRAHVRVHAHFVRNQSRIAWEKSWGTRKNLWTFRSSVRSFAHMFVEWCTSASSSFRRTHIRAWCTACVTAGRFCRDRTAISPAGSVSLSLCPFLSFSFLRVRSRSNAVALQSQEGWKRGGRGGLPWRAKGGNQPAHAGIIVARGLSRIFRDPARRVYPSSRSPVVVEVTSRETFALRHVN